MSQKSNNPNLGILNRYCFPIKRTKSHQQKTKTDGDNLVLENTNDKNVSLSCNIEKQKRNVHTCHNRGMNTEPIIDQHNALSQSVIDLTTKCSYRVRQVIQLIQSNGISKEDLLKNLGYAVELMDAIANEEQINVTDEDDINVNQDTVPLEVRDWIASTFSATVSRTSRIQKPRFRAVANAIRAGIMVEKLFKRSNEITAMRIPHDIAKFLKANVNEWCFDIFKLDDMSSGHSLRFTALDLFLRHNFFHKYRINLQHFENLCERIETGYSKYRNPYHNLVHGADVAQTCHSIVYIYQLENWMKDVQIFALIFAALIHDFEHTGTTNNYHVNTSSDLTMLYNDRGVLENHHVSSVFRIMQDPNCNIIKNLDKDDYREFRLLVIEVVLNTDMSTHFKQMKAMKSHLALGESIDKGMGMSMILHCADISHPGKDWDIHYRWTIQLLEEFFRQGDQEAKLNLPFSPLCDRKTILIPDSQIGFSNFIVEPSFTLLGHMLQFIVERTHKQGLRTSSTIREDDISTSSRRQSAIAHIPISKSSMSHPWETKIIFNRITWQKKLEQDKAQEMSNAVRDEDSAKK